MNRSILLLLLSLALYPAMAQRSASKSPSVAAPIAANEDSLNRFQVLLLSRSYGDSIVLRWAPNNALLFRAAVRGGGYILTRRSIGPDKKLKLDFTRKITPWTLDEWKQKAGPRDTLAGVCAQLLYGKTSVQKAGQAVTLDQLVQQKTQDDLLLMIGLTLADANARHAEGMGLRFTDRNVQQDAVYFYSIYPLANSKNYPTPLEKATVVNEGPISAPAMVPISAEPADRTIKLRWSRMATQEQFSAYYIERSDNGGRSFRRLHKRPWVQSSVAQFATVFEYKDSVARNYYPYQYRGGGYNAFR